MSTRQKTRKNSGMALSLAVLAAFILMITCVGLLAVSSQARTYQIHTDSTIAARSAADAGLSKAIDDMNIFFAAGQFGRPLPAETNTPLGGSNADYSYSVTNNGSIYTVTSIGHKVTGKLVRKRQRTPLTGGV